MRQFGRDLDLAQEPLGSHRERQLRLEHLERDLAVVLPVVGEVNDRIPAATELALDRVAVRKGCLQSLERFSGHAGPVLYSGR
ncbi:MAG: hypothetical protein HY560_13745 [Gemmatimonadetes bacterium]|nr:hypothetical protein [Gemmatimonadota bacterium]